MSIDRLDVPAAQVASDMAALPARQKQQLSNAEMTATDEKDSAPAPTSTHPIPLIVSRFDIAMEPAPEEDPVLTIGCIAEDGTPVALLLDEEARAKVGRWLLPEEPKLDDRLGRLADHILSAGGEWTTGKAHHWLAAEVDNGVSRHRARHSLQHLTALGYLTEHNRTGRRSYTPNYAKADA